MNLTFLNAFSVEGQLSVCGPSPLQFSADHQVALVHKKGVHVYECCAVPDPSHPSILPSRVDVPEKADVPNIGDVDTKTVMQDEDKQRIFDMLRDHILRPTGFENIAHQNYPLQAQWSPVPFYRGIDVPPGCVLGVLTSAHQLLVYCRRSRRFTPEVWTEPWELVLDLTERYNKYLLNVWDEVPRTSGSPFETYKDRLYELAITYFAWAQFEDVNDEYLCDKGKGAFKARLMTFHASGDFCIWKIGVTSTEIPQFFAKVLFRKPKLIKPDNVISCSSYLKLSPSLGLLCVGTNTGKLLCFMLKLLNPVKMEATGGSKYMISEEQCLWEEDLIRVEHLLLKRSQEDKVDVVMVKGSNSLVGTTIEFEAFSVAGNDFSLVKVPYGTISGIQFVNDNTLLLLHEPGAVSRAVYKDGEVECIENSYASIFDALRTFKKKDILIGGAVQKTEKKKRKTRVKDSDKRLVFRGLAVSLNRAIVCVARTLAVYHDHLQIRQPTQIVFYSIPFQNQKFEEILDFFKEKKYNLQRTTDGLVALRHILKPKGSEGLKNDILAWAHPIDQKSVPELQFILFSLKAIPKRDKTEWEVADAEKMFNPQSMQNLLAQEALHEFRIQLVTDRIMQKRCQTLLKTVMSNQNRKQFAIDTELNLQSVNCIEEYLRSKNLDLSSLPKVNSGPIPLCHWCKGPIQFPEEVSSILPDNITDDMKSNFDKVELVGFRWNERRHPVKQSGTHRSEICILTLLPLKFPYRRCNTCFVPALLEPAFGLLPYCPLCNGLMLPNQCTVEQPEDSDRIPDYQNDRSESDYWTDDSSDN